MITASIEDVFRRIVREEIQAAMERQLVGRAPRADDSEFLSKEEAAVFAGVSSGTIAAWVRAGSLKKHGKGRAVLISKPELVALITADRPKPQQDIEARVTAQLEKRRRHG